MKRPDLSDLTSDEKDSLIYVLMDRLEELERRLGLDSSNSGKPPSSDGYGKKPKPVNLREKTGKKPGGQKGHDGRNLRQVENPDQIINHLCPCGRCGRTLGLEQSKGYQKRQVFDRPKPQPLEVTEHRAHIGVCPDCHQETTAPFPEDVRAATQYGPNLTALVVYLQNWHFVPEDRLAELMRDVFAAALTSATIAAMTGRKAHELSGVAEEIGANVRKAAVKHMDETGLRITGVLQWLHVASTSLLTSYRTSPRRGAMMGNVTGIVVHDFWRPYFKMPGVTHALCNAHHLRELKSLIEIEKEPWALSMSRFLRQACHAANLAKERGITLKPRFVAWMLARYDRLVTAGLAFHNGLGLMENKAERLKHKRRGKIRRRPGHNLLLRLQGHKEDALRFLKNPEVPFTNNQAERDIRMMKLRQKISGCFRSETGANTFATLRTVLSTARKQGWNILDTLSKPPHTIVSNLKLA